MGLSETQEYGILQNVLGKNDKNLNKSVNCLTGRQVPELLSNYFFFKFSFSPENNKAIKNIEKNKMFNPMELLSSDVALTLATSAP